MSFDLINFSSPLVKKIAVDSLMETNDLSSQYGLTLTREQAVELSDTRFAALSDNGLFELRGGAAEKIIKTFCSSGYIMPDNYASVLNELLELFYYIKTAVNNVIPDDELIKQLDYLYNDVCRGSMDLLTGRETENLIRNINYGKHYKDRVDLSEEAEDENEDEQ